MQDGAGVPLDHLVVVGGAIRNRFWMQNKADMVAALSRCEVEDGHTQARPCWPASVWGSIETSRMRSSRCANRRHLRARLALTARYADLL